MINQEFLLERVENIVAKGEIACFDKFLLLPQSFQTSSAADTSTSDERGLKKEQSDLHVLFSRI